MHSIQPDLFGDYCPTPVPITPLPAVDPETDTRRSFCSKCHTSKKISEFSKRRSKRSGVYDWCKACNNAYLRARYKTDSGFGEMRKQHLKRAYGITPEQYDTMFKRQGGLCAICRKPETAKHKSGTLKSLAVDHNHETNQVRALLCSACNKGIGSLKESPEIMSAAIEYLQSHKAEVLNV